MKIGKPIEHVCKYFTTNLKYRWRMCTYCKKVQYNYTGTWENTLTLNQFLDTWVGGMGSGEDDIAFIYSHPFEARSYESWDRMFKVSFLSGKYAGQIFGRFDNYNEADFALRKAGLVPLRDRIKEIQELKKRLTTA